VILSAADPSAIAQAARVLANGGLVGMPTETVYGLAARADDTQAVRTIFAAKGRPLDHPLIVHVADLAAVDWFAQTTNPLTRRLMERAWPGPVSVVLPRRAGVAEAAAAGQPSVALRCPAHPVAQALLRACEALGIPGLAAPSANRFGRVSPTTAQHVADEFGQALLVLDGGPCAEGIESAIVDARGPQPRLLRPGSVPREHLEALLDAPVLWADAASPRLSGSLEAHYAPAAKLVLLPATARSQTLQALVREQGVGRVAWWRREPGAGPAAGPTDTVVSGLGDVRAMPDNPSGAAHELFAQLRRWDAAGYPVIAVDEPPAGSAWDGVRDRLRRAAAASAPVTTPEPRDKT
jgi:L-threonylcarbamoyladenylate synthase